MNLTLHDIQTITHGALATCESEKGFTFRRMTLQQLAAIDDIPRYANRSRFCSGVRFDFWTDASALSFAYEILSIEETRNFFGMDIYVDDIMIDTLWEKPVTRTNGTVQFAINPSEKRQTAPALSDAAALSCVPASSKDLHRITIYLPYSVNCAIKDFVLCDATEFLPFNYPNGTLLCYGDSITQGFDALHPSMTYAVRLSRSLGMELINQAICGYVFDAETIDAAHVPAPEIVTVAYGTNDWTNKPTLSEIKSDIDAYLDKLVTSFPDSRLYVILPIWRGDCMEQTEAGSFSEVRDILRASAMRYPQITILDGQAAVPHHSDFFADEMLHPDDTGMLLYAQWLGNYIQRS